ncbi:hypothetical protein NM96_02870 [Neisseria mucosa]|nr:hypothetical protein NM96_02870 [Neisseria mucosa]
MHFGNEIEHKILVTYVIAKVSLSTLLQYFALSRVRYKRNRMDGDLRGTIRHTQYRLSDYLCHTASTFGTLTLSQRPQTKNIQCRLTTHRLKTADPSTLTPAIRHGGAKEIKL